jgi:[glutamine synthetase] adenylyltransferase / [glutamine synthetase]-adenylyl-L-tyrosine phosphorylase
MVTPPSVKPALAPNSLPRAALQFAGSAWESAAAAAAHNAPYLARLMARRADLIAAPDQDWPERLLHEALREAAEIAGAPPPMDEAMRRLRRAKDAVHLGAAIADLAGDWDLTRVTGALTDFADAALRAAVTLAAQEGALRGDLDAEALAAAHGAPAGYALIAMGKMGARELNYSSDIDFSVFFDSARLPIGKGKEPQVVAVRMIAPLVRALEEVTPDGYVFRTDLRLRPDPGSTRPAVSIASAAHYYQTLGQNWERAAFIKARAAAGDLRCGREFLLELLPFVWRKHLDFAAVSDVHSIKRQILSAHGSADLGAAVFDVKLGRGGIRDIELFVQTQQLILGGRNRALRKPATLAALDALAGAGVVSGASRDALAEAYVFFRNVEHRVQMLEDSHSHAVPANVETRARLAALCGFDALCAFDAALIERRAIVSEIDHELFGASPSLADPLGSLIFTGVEDHPETLNTIAKLGYRKPEFVSQTIRGWHHGRVRAMRSERARELLTALTPRLLRALAGGGDPDQAFVRFSMFFAGLSAGVQVLALLSARPALLDELARLFGLAPRLAEELSRRPALLDAMIEPRFMAPLPNDAPGGRRSELAARIAETSSFEQAINEARRFQREEAFRIGVQVLAGVAPAAAAGAAHADLADACVALMAEVASAEVERVNGKAPGVFAVLGLGKFGGRELADRSDLDIMVVYDAPEQAGAAGDFYTRFAQRLITALSARTEEGVLYEVDMQLRPSGSKGPVAVRLSSFERYYSQEAWTWELQALTRLRFAAGDAALGARAQEIARAKLASPSDEAKIRRDVADMRALMDRERPARSPWDLKLAPGGFVDVEFIAQALQLIWAARGRDVIDANTGAALEKLAAAGAFEAADWALLEQAWRLYSDLQQVLRVCADGPFEPAGAPEVMLARLAELGGAADFAALEAKLISAEAQVRAAFTRLVGAPGDGKPPAQR